MERKADVVTIKAAGQPSAAGGPVAQGDVPPLITSRKRAFVLRRWATTCCGGVRTCFSPEAMVPAFITLLQLLLLATPPLLGVCAAVLVELGVVGEYAGAGIAAGSSMVFMGLLQALRRRRKPSQLQDSVIMADEEEEGYDFDSVCSSSTLDYLLPRRQPTVLIVHTVLLGVLMTGAVTFLHIGRVDAKYGSAAGVYLVFGWATVALTAYPIVAKPPVEISRFNAQGDPFPELFRWCYTVAIMVVELLQRELDTSTSVSSALRIVFVLLPLLWATGFIAAPTTAVEWAAEQGLVYLLGGSYAASLPRLVLHLTAGCVCWAACCCCYAYISSTAMAGAALASAYWLSGNLFALLPPPTLTRAQRYGLPSSAASEDLPRDKQRHQRAFEQLGRRTSFMGLVACCGYRACALLCSCCAKRRTRRVFPMSYSTDVLATPMTIDKSKLHPHARSSSQSTSNAYTTDAHIHAQTKETEVKDTKSFSVIRTAPQRGVEKKSSDKEDKQEERDWAAEVAAELGLPGDEADQVDTADDQQDDDLGLLDSDDDEDDDVLGVPGPGLLKGGGKDVLGQDDAAVAKELEELFGLDEPDDPVPVVADTSASPRRNGSAKPVSSGNGVSGKVDPTATASSPATDKLSVATVLAKPTKVLAADSVTERKTEEPVNGVSSERPGSAQSSGSEAPQPKYNELLTSLTWNSVVDHYRVTGRLLVSLGFFAVGCIISVLGGDDLTNETLSLREDTARLVLDMGAVGLLVIRWLAQERARPYRLFGLVRQSGYKPLADHTSPSISSVIYELTCFGWLSALALTRMALPAESNVSWGQLIWFSLLTLRVLRWTVQNQPRALEDIVVLVLLDRLDLSGWSSLAFVERSAVVTVAMARGRELLKLMCYMTVHTWTCWSIPKLKVQHPSLLLAIVIAMFPVHLAVLAAAAALDAPVVPLFGAPVFVLGFPRPRRSWPSLSPSGEASREGQYYMQLSQKVATNVCALMDNGLGPLGTLDAGDMLLVRHEPFLLWIQVLERGHNYCTIVAKGLELQQTSCHTVEASEVDQLIEDLADGRSLLNPNIGHSPQLTAQLRTSVYSLTTTALTGLIDDAEVLRLVPKLFLQMLMLNLHRKFPKGRKLPDSFLETPWSTQQLNDVDIPQALSSKLLGAPPQHVTPSAPPRRGAGMWASTAHPLLTVAAACYLVVEEQPLQGPRAVKHVVDVFSGRLPASLRSEYLTQPARKDLLALTLQSYRYAVKAVYDAFGLGELELLKEDSAATVRRVREMAVEYHDWSMGPPSSPSPALFPSDVVEYFDVTKDKNSSKVSSSSAQLQPAVLSAFSLNAAAVRAIWASLTMELLYVSNDDDERYSIQAHPLLLRNLTVQTSEAPFGYPQYCSGPVDTVLW